MENPNYETPSKSFEGMKNARKDRVSPAAFKKAIDVQNFVNQKVIMNALQLILLNTNVSDCSKVLDEIKSASDNTDKILQDLKQYSFLN